MERERIIEALKICDSNYDGVVCKKCPIKDEDYNGSWYDKDGSCYQHLMREAAELLSEQPEIKKGHWIAPKYYPTQFTYTCSKCGYKQSFSGKFKFCPNCGADMKGEIIGKVD